MSRKLLHPRIACRLHSTLFTKNHSRIGNSPLTTIVTSFSRNIGSINDVLGAHKSYISPLDQKPRQSLVHTADLDLVAAIYDEADNQREVLLKTSRDIVKGAKKAIYDLHRNQIEDAKLKIQEADTIIEGLAPIRKANPRLSEESLYRGGLEELVEAKCFCHYLETGMLLTYQELNGNSGVYSVEDYIGGVCDFTGEIGRHAVHCSIARQSREVIAAYHIVDQIMGQLAKISIRNRSGANDDLRRKFDTIKWTLQKIEQLVYDISLQKGSNND